MRLRKDNKGLALPLALMVILVVVVLVSVTVAMPYMSRTEDYANDPTDPPDEVVDGSGGGSDDGGDDDTNLDPDWQGKFDIKAQVNAGRSVANYDAYKVSSVAVSDMDLSLEVYDGQPWSAASIWAAAFGQLRPPPRYYTVEWELSISKGSTIIKDDGTFKATKDSDIKYSGSGTSKYFFFWGEQDGTWTYTLKLTTSGKSTTQTGTLSLTRGSVVVN